MTVEPWKIALEEVLNVDRVSEVDQGFVEMLRNMVLEAAEWCSNPLVDESLRRNACGRFFELLDKFLKTFVKLRASKAVEGVEPRGFDKRILNMILAALTMFAELSIFGLRVLDEDVLCKILKPVPLRRSIATPGYVVSLPLWEAAILAALGYVKPLTLPREIISF